MSQTTPTTAPASPATHPLQVATPPLQNATLCYTPTTPDKDHESAVNSGHSSTCTPECSAACYTCDSSPATGDVLSPELAGGSSSAATVQPPATCSTDSPSLLRLTPVQRQALDLLQAGRSVAATARTLHVHRITVQRWKTHHPRFIAELAARAAFSQAELSLKAQHILSTAISIVHKRLAAGRGDALATSLRLLASPRFARLASASDSTSLQQTLAHLQQVRSLPASAAPDPAILADLTAELDAPLPPAAPRPRPEPDRVVPNAHRDGVFPGATLELRLAKHPIRPELLAAFQHYGAQPADCDTAARRPDLVPFDIHYFANLCYPGENNATILPRYFSRPTPPAGIEEPLLPSVLRRMISNGQVTRLCGQSLDGYTATAEPGATELVLTHPTKPTLTIPRDHLWRDAALA